MKHICTHCRRTSADGYLWCEDIECPAGKLPTLMNYGDFLGNLQIVRLVRVIKTAVVYEVILDKQTYLLKVANQGCENYLQRETYIIQALNAAVPNHTAIPKLVADKIANGGEPYGISTFRGETVYYTLFEHVKGEFLSDYLLNNPEPWHQHVGWFIKTLAEAIHFLHNLALGEGEEGYLHLNLNPDNIVVRLNKAGAPQPVVLDMGILEPLVTDKNDARQKATNPLVLSDIQRFERFSLTAYIPPELSSINVTRTVMLTPATDVYGLGLLLYEMLAGHPAYEYKLKKRDVILNQVGSLNAAPATLTREDLPSITSPQLQLALIDVVNRATSKAPERRYATAKELHDQLEVLYGPVRERSVSRFMSNPRTTLMVAISLILTALGITLFILLMLVLATRFSA
jgi:serine/threonine protein kinase